MFVFTNRMIQEEILTTGVARELEQTISTIQKNEIQRNRDRVIEITAFKERCQFEIEQAEDNS